MSVESLTSIPSRSEIIGDYRRRGHLIAAVLPIHYPRALLRTFNVLPIEVWGPPGVDASHGSAHVQPYFCSVVRNALSFLKSGGLDVADLLVVPHACDSLQGLGSVLLDFVKPRQPVIPLYIPRGEHARAVEFLADEFRWLYGQLERIAHRSPSDSDLMESIWREEAADTLLVQLHQNRKDLQLDDFQFYHLIRTREFMPAETFSQMASRALECHSGANHDGVPIILSGIVPEPMEIFESITKLGGVVVADDLACCGRRLYPPGQSDDPYLRLAERIIGAPPDSTRGNSIQERLEHLHAMIETSGAKGVIFYPVKFCEPELFDLPDLRKGLQNLGVPSLTLEVDLNDPLSNQALTRIEAFFEMIA